MIASAWRCSLLATLLVGITGCAAQQTETASGGPLARQIAQSGHCGLTAPGLVVLADRGDVDRLEALPARNLSLAPLRAVDFNREKVVLVAMGQKSTGGYSVTLAGSRIVDQQLVLSVASRVPDPGTMVTQALTTPCTAIAVTASGWSELRIVEAENNR